LVPIDSVIGTSIMGVFVTGFYLAPASTLKCSQCYI